MWSMYLLSEHPHWQVRLTLAPHSFSYGGCSNPSLCQTRLREEVWSVCGRPGDVASPARPPASYSDIAALPLLNCAVYEVLRIFPPIATVLREALEDVEITVEAGKHDAPVSSSGGRSAGQLEPEAVDSAGRPAAAPPTRTLVIRAGTNIDLSIACLHREARYWGPDVDLFNPDRFKDGISGAVRHPLAFLPFSAGPRNCIGAQFALLEAKVILAVLLQVCTVLMFVQMEERVHYVGYVLPLLVLSCILTWPRILPCSYPELRVDDWSWLPPPTLTRPRPCSKARAAHSPTSHCVMQLLTATLAFGTM